MPLVTPAIDALGGRVLCSLVEKERTTPNAYPLTLAAVVTACNQATGRDPVMTTGADEVDRSLGELRAAGLVRLLHPRSGRGVTKYRHVLGEAVGLDDGQVAVLAVLVLRGPQTAGELRARAERFRSPHEDGDIDVDDVLGRLARVELAERLARSPGQSADRWITRWGRDDVSSPGRAVVGDAASRAGDGPSGSAGGGALRAVGGEVVASIGEGSPVIEGSPGDPLGQSPTGARMGRLEARVATLEDEVRRLRETLAPLLDDGGADLPAG